MMNDHLTAVTIADVETLAVALYESHARVFEGAPVFHYSALTARQRYAWRKTAAEMLVEAASQGDMVKTEMRNAGTVE